MKHNLLNKLLSLTLLIMGGGHFLTPRGQYLTFIPLTVNTGEIQATHGFQVKKVINFHQDVAFR